MSKPEFEPLLSPGFHCYTLGQLRKSFVLPFVTSRSRPVLLSGLRKFVIELRALNISGELWFDGSFVSEKQDPCDVDLVVVMNPCSFNQMSDTRAAALRRLLDNPTSKARFGCDVYCVSAADLNGVSYWRGWFAFKRDGKTPKGIGFILL